MADLYHTQYLPHEELKALAMCEKYDLMANDTISAISSYELSLRAYFFMNMPDSVLSVTENSRKAYLDRGEIQRAAMLLNAAISILIDRGEYDKAAKYMREMEHNSGYFDSQGNIMQDKILYLYEKGRYMLYQNKLDSAKIYFNKLLPTEKEAAFQGLLALYEKTGQADSVMKYSRLYAAANDSSFLNNNAKTIMQMTAMYNYSNQQRLAEQHEHAANIAQHRLFISILLTTLLVIIILLIIAFLLHAKRLNDYKITQMTTAYFDVVNQKEQAERDIKELEQASLIKESNLRMEIDTVIKQHKVELIQKENELNALRRQVEYYSGNLDLEDFEKRLNAFKDTAIFTKVKQSIMFKDTDMKLTKDDWKKFEHLYKQYFPAYYKYITSNSQLYQDEKLVSFLLLFDFSSTEISLILSKSVSRISNVRLFLNQKLFGCDSAATLNENLRSKFLL